MRSWFRIASSFASHFALRLASWFASCFAQSNFRFHGSNPPPVLPPDSPAVDLSPAHLAPTLPLGRPPPARPTPFLFKKLNRCHSENKETRSFVFLERTYSD